MKLCEADLAFGWHTPCLKSRHSCMLLAGIHSVEAVNSGQQIVQTCIKKIIHLTPFIDDTPSIFISTYLILDVSIITYLYIPDQKLAEVHMDVNIEMKTINFYTTQEGKTPVAQFLDSLPAKQAQKITWVLQLVEELDVIPTTYLKKLVNTQDIWEVRAQVGNNIFRLLGFFDGDNLVVLNHGFQKKTQKTPAKDIKLAEQRRRDFLRRKKQ